MFDKIKKMIVPVIPGNYEKSWLFDANLSCCEPMGRILVLQKNFISSIVVLFDAKIQRNI